MVKENFLSNHFCRFHFTFGCSFFFFFPFFFLHVVLVMVFYFKLFSLFPLLPESPTVQTCYNYLVPPNAAHTGRPSLSCKVSPVLSDSRPLSLRPPTLPSLFFASPSDPAVRPQGGCAFFSDGRQARFRGRLPNTRSAQRFINFSRAESPPPPSPVSPTSYNSLPAPSWPSVLVVRTTFRQPVIDPSFRWESRP